MRNVEKRDLTTVLINRGRVKLTISLLERRWSEGIIRNAFERREGEGHYKRFV
jgi:hypothetical protein